MKPRRLIIGIIPTNKCNLQCPYCYISQLPDYMKMEQKFEYSPEYIANCLNPERLGGVSLINFTGEGETMLQPGLVELCRLLLEQGHYLEIVTNLTVTKVVNEFLDIPSELQKHLEFKVSFHYNELIRKRMLDRFADNLDRIQNSSFSFSLEVMSSDNQMKYIPEIIEWSKKHVGSKCHVTVGRTENTKDKRLLTDYPIDKYIESWSVFDSEMFRFKMDLLGIKRKEFCYAGDWTLFLNLHTGEARSCYAQPDSQNIFKNPDKPIRFRAVGKHCAQPYCFNGHAHLSLGVIPEMKSPTYLEIRNRVREDGSEWFSDDAKMFFSSKLNETNKDYSRFKKVRNYFGWYGRLIVFAFTNPKIVLRFFRISYEKSKNK